MPALEKAPLCKEAKPSSSRKAASGSSPSEGEPKDGDEGEGDKVTEDDGQQQVTAEPTQNGAELLKPFPVVIYSHGLSGIRTNSSGLLCDLASHGYVVASVEHR